MKIHKILSLTLLLTLCLNPLAGAAQLDSCSGNEGCPHCNDLKHFSSHAPKEASSSPVGCCDRTGEPACNIGINLSYVDFSYTITTRRTNHFETSLYFLAAADFLEQFNLSTALKGQTQITSHPFSTPIYIHNLSLLC